MPEFIPGSDTRQGLGTLGHPGIFVGQARSLGIKNHIDIPYVTALAPERPLDFGVLDLWALRQRTESPLLTLAIDNAQVIYTDADYYTYELPSAADATTRLVAGGLDKDKQGMDGEEIPFVVTRRDLSAGSIFKFDLTSRISFTVVDRPIEQMGEHFKVWAVLNTNSQVKFVTKAEFQPQRQIVKLADMRGLDFSSHKSVWSISGVPSLAKYKNYLSNMMLQQSYRVTSGAVEYLNHHTRIDARQISMMEQTVLQFYQVRGIADNKVIDLRNPESYKLYFERLQEEKVKGNGEAAMVNLLDSIAINLMQKQNNDIMIWSDQIDNIRDGYDTQRLVPGVWFQLDMAGYKHTYSIDTFTLDTLTDAIKDFEFGKVPLRESISDNVYVIRTGRGGSELIYKAFLKSGFQIPAQLQNAEFGFITGPNAANLTYNAARFVKYQIPNIGYLSVEWEPGFDPVKADEFVNPVLPGGYRLSSYTMLIEDYNTSRDNIAIIRKNGHKMRMIVEAGDNTHPLLRSTTSINGQNISVSQASDELSGYQVKFVSKADSAIVKDPTKLLKLVPKNPRTGIAAL
jgi:hypothetical protein